MTKRNQAYLRESNEIDLLTFMWKYSATIKDQRYCLLMIVELSKLLGCDSKSVHRYLKDLYDYELVEPVGDHRWRVTPKGVGLLVVRGIIQVEGDVQADGTAKIVKSAV